ncbi:IS4 family transposase [Sediminibacterium sp.]|uniref:IS4 family transposase n=1 Tax=Sediminibacterium sp. TaxID=1917865 RepID=UPI0025FE029A|nr:IS4 family transposase [Sediminibacterium sp.]MBT9485423.1 IS4 family transposase [Sediminibacterium sp.]
MNIGKYVFAQVVSFIDPNDFKNCVDRYSGNYKVKEFTCWHQLLCLMFGQLANRESLSDLILCLQTQKNKWYHLGIGTSISKSNLAYANEHRNWKIFADYAYMLIAEAQRYTTPNKELESFENRAVYAIDTTTIDLCLSVFWWAKFRKHKAAIKLHTVLDIKTEIPCYIHITDGTVHEVNVLDTIDFEQNGFYVMDRGFVDYERLYSINQKQAFFVTRAKTNMKCRRIYSSKVDKTTGVLYDQTIQLVNFYALKQYPEKLRRVKYFDEESNKKFIFLTNNFELTALQIALLYRYRWKIELFFKWIKQHLKVKSFWGHSENAVKIQVYVAIISFVTVALVKQKLKTPLTQYQILQILSLTLLNKTPLNQLFQDTLLQNIPDSDDNQLKMF